jgi:hypothetical protein
MKNRIVRSLTTTGLLVLGLAATSSLAQATLIISPIPVVGGGPQAGATYVNFDNLAGTGNAGGVSNGVTVAFDGAAPPPGGQTWTPPPNSNPGVNAAPYLSNSNGTLFGDPNNGEDTTPYLTTGTGSVTLSFAPGQTYLGLLWGSVDLYNTLTFYSGATNLGAITGGDVTAAANGDQGASGTFYVNIHSTVGFDRVVATSSQYAFEFDNVAYATPEPSTLISASMAGLLGLGYSLNRYRRRMKAIA